MGLYINTSSVFTSDNTVLTNGTYGVESDTGHVKLGNGSTAWNDLTYYSLISDFTLQTILDTYLVGLNTGNPIKSKNANYSMLYYDSIIMVTTGSSEIEITLPRPSLTDYEFNGLTMVRSYNIQKADNGSGRVKILPFGSEKILGENFQYLNVQYDNFTLFSDTTNWFEK